MDYTTARITTSSTNADYENKNAKYYLTGASNIRVGGEFRFDIWALRGGVGLYGTPYSSKAELATENNGSVVIWSLGAGYHPGTFFMDFAYQVYNSSYYYAPYVTDIGQSTNVKDVRSTGILTLGWKF